jgi:hypothetical protein
MSITRFTSVLAALVTALALAPHGHAQLFKPFAFPPVESDFQFFAPADVDTYGGGPEQKTGWFADYDRVYMNVSRPNDAYFESNKEGDFTWGNRIEVGYVDDGKKGWLFTGWHIDGPNQDNVVITERMNRWMDNTTTGTTGTTTVLYPRRDDNNPLTGERDYLVTNSINVADLTGAELNRTWELDQLHYGTFLTPFVGLRYVKFKDYYRRETYTRWDEDGFTPPVFPPVGVDDLTATTEALESLQASVTNDMLGGQLGVRWSKDYSRWNFSGDFKAFALENFQYWRHVTETEVSIYAGALPQDGTVPDTVVIFQSDGGSDSDNEFVFGMELRFDAAYRLTRDLSLRGGAEFMDFGRGIGRGLNVADNNQDVIMYGFTMGITWNR